MPISFKIMLFPIFFFKNQKCRADKVDKQQQRLTPCKFTTSHSTANWQNGLMALVKPRYSSNGFTDVVKIINMGEK
jgi:hypothetical protein